MLPSLLFEIMLIGVLGIGSQWIAWKFRIPAIVAMASAGLLAGPVFGVMNPQEDFGELYRPMISAAVAIILFTGSLNLRFKELKGLEKPVFRISTIGALIAWLLGVLAAHYAAGLSWTVASVIGALFIVTGPTVIAPLLRQAKLKPRPAKILKWESIVVDPFGALLAVFTFEIISYFTAAEPSLSKLILFFAAAAFAALFGWLCGKGIGWLFENGHVPEFLKSPAVFAAVIFCFTVPDALEHQTGLLSVTAMGMTLANMRNNSLADMRHFKENISIMFISAIFIMLTASLKIEVIEHIFTLKIIGYVVFMMLIVRPASIFLSTIGSGLSLQEKTLVGWIAPRGIVALTVSGYFANVLFDAGYEDAGILTTLTFGLVFFTVIAHGFSLGWLARSLGLSRTGNPGVLIVGSNPFTAALAKTLQQEKVPAMIVDSSRDRLSHAREAGVPFYQGEMLSEQTEHNLDTISYESLIAATDFDAYNALVATTFVPEYGRKHIYRIMPFEQVDESRNDLALNVGGRFLFKKKRTMTDLLEKLESGYQFCKTNMTPQFGYQQFLQEQQGDTVYLFIIRKTGRLLFFTTDQEITAETGDVLFTLSAPKE